jgi:hypothetical protein
VEGTTQPSNYWGCVEWKEAKAALAKRTPVRNKEGSAPSLATAEVKCEEPTAKQEILGPGWNHVCGGRVVKATPTDPIPTPEPVIAPTPKVVVTTRAKGKAAKSTPKVTVGPKQTPVTKSPNNWWLQSFPNSPL